MKKVLLFCLATILVINGVSCGRPTALFDGAKELKITVLEAGGSDYLSEADHQTEFNTKNKSEKNPQAKQWKNGLINGVNYRAEYKDSSIGYQWQGQLDNYQAKNDNYRIKVSVNQDTGRVDYYSLLFNDGSEPTAKDDGIERYRSIAQQYLGKYVDDASNYSVVWEERYEHTRRYGFVFAKIVDGVRLSKARIAVYFDGTVGFHDFTELGSVLEEELPSQENMAKIETAVESKVQDIYDSVKDKHDYTYEVDDVVFVRLADGTYAMEYYLVVTLTSVLLPDSTFSEITRLIVLLEEIE